MIPPDPAWLTLAEASRRLGVCQRQLRRFAVEIPMRIDGYARLSAEDVAALEARWAQERLDRPTSRP